MKLRVALILDQLELGGAEKQALILAQGLRKRGHSVTIVGSAPGAAFDEARKRGIDAIVASFPGEGSLCGAIVAGVSLLFQLRRVRAHCFIGHMYRPNMLLAVAWRFTGAKAFIWNQRDLGMGFGRWPRVERFLVSSASHWITNSHAGKHFLVSCGVAPVGVSIIRNGVELTPAQRSRLKWRETLAVPEGGFLVVKVANLTSAKDHATVIRALAAGGRTDFILAIAGRDDGRGVSLRQLAATLGISTSIRFIGHTEDISGLLSAADLCIHSSPSESSSNAIVEAALCRVPIICSDIPANREALPTLPERHFFKVGDSHGLQQRFAEFAANPTQFSTSTNKAFDYATNNFSVDRMVGEVIAVLARSCGRVSWRKDE